MMTTVQFNIPFDAVVEAIKNLDAQKQRELFALLNDLLFEQEEDAIENDPAVMAEIEEARQAYRDGDYQTIQIRVSEEVAKRFAAASEEERYKTEALLRLQLGDLTKPERSLEEIMDSMSAHAQSRGLTPEILESILNDE